MNPQPCQDLDEDVEEAKSHLTDDVLWLCDQFYRSGRGWGLFFGILIGLLGGSCLAVLCLV